jgi:hypothetical protein
MGSANARGRRRALASLECTGCIGIAGFGIRSGLLDDADCPRSCRRELAMGDRENYLCGCWFCRRSFLEIGIGGDAHFLLGKYALDERHSRNALSGIHTAVLQRLPGGRPSDDRPGTCRGFNRRRVDMGATSGRPVVAGEIVNAPGQVTTIKRKNLTVAPPSLTIKQYSPPKEHKWRPQQRPPLL